MGRGIAQHILTPITGMRLVAVANRDLPQAVRAYTDAGATEIRDVSSVAELEGAVSSCSYAVTDDAELLCRAGNIDILIESTGDVEFGAQVACEAIANGKHLVLMNAELDSTLGPILKVRADRAGVVITNTDGDEPGVAMNLYRFVKTVGMCPVAAGNIKGMLDRYRTPETQRAFAEKAKQRPRMVTSFADGTKLSMETTVLANATGFHVGRRGMYGHRCGHVKEVINLLPLDELLSGGLVDYVVGAEPYTGAFVVGYCEGRIKQQYLGTFKMGDGPLYAFYTPYHLPHIQIITTVARAALFQDPTIAPKGRPYCEVITMAKRDLKAGETLDGIGGFSCYGIIDNAEVQRQQRLLPMGLSEGCRLMRDIAKDEAIGYADVVVPTGRLCDRLRAEQDAHFAQEFDPASRLAVVSGD
jgi:predicted homoserine dehydrogenase-like protein